jgi:hypothetical protein
MSAAQTMTTFAEARFRARFVERARRNGVKESALRGHLRRAENYMMAFPGNRLGERSHRYVTC